MGGFLLFIIFIVLVFIIVVLNAGISILRGIFNIFTGKQPTGRNRSFQEDDNDEPNERSTSSESQHKIFQKDEGEYVDFVEYKEEDKKTE
ncbi:MAG: hypothetical protein QM654_17525 [Dysgonamonadaceae bacterium]